MSALTLFNRCCRVEALTLKLASINVQHSAATVTSCVQHNAATVKRRRPVHVDAP